MKYFCDWTVTALVIFAVILSYCFVLKSIHPVQVWWGYYGEGCQLAWEMSRHQSWRPHHWPGFWERHDVHWTGVLACAEGKMDWPFSVVFLTCIGIFKLKCVHLQGVSDVLHQNQDKLIHFFSSFGLIIPMPDSWFSCKACHLKAEQTELKILFSMKKSLDKNNIDQFSTIQLFLLPGKERVHQPQWCWLLRPGSNAVKICGQVRRLWKYWIWG